MYEKLIERIVEAANNHTLTFFVGAGISSTSGAPSWNSLIDDINEELGKTKMGKYSSDECLRIPQEYYYSLGENRKKYSEFIMSRIYDSNLKPNELHYMMMKLAPASFMTTNYDNLIELAAIDCCKTYKCISADQDIPDIKGDKFVLKVHGDFEHENFVLKEEDYLNYEEQFKLVSTVMKSVFSTNTVVFIGYGINDYNIKLILNWERTLLHDKFRPIFILPNLKNLNEAELSYHQSRGLDVIEFCKLCCPDGIAQDDYFSRYKGVLSAILDVKNRTIGEMSDEEAFVTLYDRCCPLDKLAALRKSDISKVLGTGCTISDDGIITVLSEVSTFKKFVSIGLSESRDEILEADIRRYKLIHRVLKKARIRQINDVSKELLSIESSSIFADSHCLNLDYSYMNSYCKKDLSELAAKCRQAFYLTRLFRYDKAFGMYARIAKEAYQAKDYLFFYIAGVNCINLKKLLRSVNRTWKAYDVDKLLKEFPIFDNEEFLFDSLPLEFKDKYPSLRDLSTNSLLYKYCFEANQDAKKVSEAMEAHSIEFGLPSSGKVACQINEYLHFLLGNGICADVFFEYQTAVRDLMAILVKKFVSQEKKALTDSMMSEIPQAKVTFDQLDFYCLITFFSKKELEKMFQRCGCNHISFVDMEPIEQGITNLLRFYERAVSEKMSTLENANWQRLLCSCFTVVKFTEVSSLLLEKVCRFMLKYQFPEFEIDDKIYFLDKQIYSKQNDSSAIRSIIEDTLLEYVDARISSKIEGTPFQVYSKSPRINYYNLADYLDVKKKGYTSRRLCKRVSRIIENKIAEMEKEVVEHYFKYISAELKRGMLERIETELSESFSFTRFSLLLDSNRKRAQMYIEQLKGYLWALDRKAKKDEKKTTCGVHIYPETNPYEELNSVGFWCLINYLPKKAFNEFVGLSDEFDFLIMYDKFDFNKFDVAWLLKYNRYALERISKSIKVRRKIQKVVAHTLIADQLRTDEKERLQKILAEYFSET